MPKYKQSHTPRRNYSIPAIFTCIFLAAAIFIVYNHYKKNASETPETIAEKQDVSVPVSGKKQIRFEDIGKDEELKDLMDDRKSKYNVDDGLDMIVQSDESVKIGETTIEMKEIIQKANLKSGKLLEDDLLNDSKGPLETVEDYGIYIVQPHDNIWNIHFKLLRNYFTNKGVSLSPLADEPKDGSSTGIGKLLKFSEKMVYIFNLKDKKIESDINVIQPLSKIVVYNMQEIFELLEQIDYEEINRIQFDGETIWLPAEQ